MSLMAMKEKWMSARDRFDSERRPLVVAVLYVHANVRHARTRVVSYVSFERDVCMFIRYMLFFSHQEMEGIVITLLFGSQALCQIPAFFLYPVFTGIMI